ncbi:MAG: phytanoyl-CoA dioxygenase family protein [Acidimicrobiales bacterium]
MTSTSSLGWAEAGPDDPHIVELRDHLSANNGIRGLEVFGPGDIEDIIRVFRRDGFAVVADVLTADQVEFLRRGCDDVVRRVLDVDPDRRGNRGSHRYSFGAVSTTRSQLHRPEWQMLIDLPTLTPIISALFGTPDYLLRSASGDFCLPGAYRYQPLHSDMRDWQSAEATPHSSFHDPRGLVSTRELPCPYICANFLTIDATALNGPTRQIPGTQHSREPFPTLDEEPEWMRLSTVCPAPAGAVQIRDVRAWHGGTPNLSNDVRSIPNVEFYAPWFREPITRSISYDDYRGLSDHARKLAQFHVLDSTEALDPGIHLNVTPPRLSTP